MPAFINLPDGRLLSVSAHALQRWCEYTPCRRHGDALAQLNVLSRQIGLVVVEPPTWCMARIDNLERSKKRGKFYLLLGDFALPVVCDEETAWPRATTVLARGSLPDDVREQRTQARRRRRARVHGRAYKRQKRHTAHVRHELRDRDAG